MLQHFKEYHNFPERSFCKKKKHFSERISILCQTVVHWHCWHGASSTNASCHLANTSGYLANLYKPRTKTRKTSEKGKRYPWHQKTFLCLGVKNRVFLVCVSCFCFVCFFCCFFLFTGCRDLPDDRRYLANKKRHLCVRLHANIAKTKNNTYFYNLQKPTPHKYPFCSSNNNNNNQ